MSFSISTIRHSAAHILAQAVLRLYPNAKLGIGPAIEDGFYYDFDLEHSISTDDLVKIQLEMDAIIKEKQPFKHYSLDSKDALKLFEKRGDLYKMELIQDLDLDCVSIYENGPFIDLCKGPHVESTNDVFAVKLLRVSGAYWRGSEKNKMLQRIYGTAFHTNKELRLYLNQLEEAKNRDHRKIGKELQLFSVMEDIGGGLVLWHPKGAKVRQIIEDIWRKLHHENGYEMVVSPHVGKADLWKTSGHLDFYQENMYASMDVDDVPYYVKPMNCPFHILIFNQHQMSYRDLPVRYAELGTVYRYERSGVLHGLMRVRGFTQDDAHIFCSEDQVEEEVLLAVQMSLDMLNQFGFQDVSVFLSTRPKEKYVGEENEWHVAERALSGALKKMAISYAIDDGGGAFYGPKIDIKIKDSIGRQWQCSTVQFDFNLPQRFGISYINSNGEKQRPYMIHRALLGSLERFFGVLIEHYAGKFPVFLAPIQCRFIFLVSDTAEYRKVLEETCQLQAIRYDIDDSHEKLGYKVRKAQLEKIPIVGIIGKKELETGTISIRYRDSNDQSIVSLGELISEIKT